MALVRAAVAGALAITLSITVAACSDDRPLGTDPPASTSPVATDLAPSQLTASTVASPEGPPPCNVDDLAFVAGDEGIVVIRNTGPIECEVDVSDSPNRDPLMEPSIWLHPASEGELAVEPDDGECGQPAPLTSVDLVVNGRAVAAPVALPAACSATLVAIYTAD
jgi:hypothetical protein